MIKMNDALVTSQVSHDFCDQMWMIILWTCHVSLEVEKLSDQFVLCS
jgi:hypothetical protein